MDRFEEQGLIHRAARGDRSAIESLVRAHQASLYSFVFRLTGRPEVAEDVVQEAFVRVLGSIDRFDPRFRFSTWLFTIARRLYLNAAQKLTPGFDTDAVERRTSGTARPELRLAGQDQARGDRDLIDHALAVLSGEQREIVLLFHQHDWPIKTIAEHMQMPEGTVKSHLHRARRTLRLAIESLSQARVARINSAGAGSGAQVDGHALRLAHPHAGLPGAARSHGPAGTARDLDAPDNNTMLREQRPAPALRISQREVRL